MKIETFEDIIAWQKAKQLTLLIYEIFKDSKDFGIKNQIERASVSIMNNIAEGFERKSDKDFSKFLFIAKGSTAEVRSMLYIALELEYLDKEEYQECYLLTQEISKLLSGFIKSIY